MPISNLRREGMIGFLVFTALAVQFLILKGFTFEKIYIRRVFLLNNFKAVVEGLNL